MCNRILGIAGLMIRQALRSRFVLCLLVLMLSVLAGFALTIKGDGTAAGRLQVLLSYAVSVVGGILSIATLWLACGSLSVEIENRCIHLVVVKPVRSIELWLGKWLGIVGMAMLLLVVAGLFLVAAAGVAQWRTYPESVDGKAVRERILLARQAVAGVRVARAGAGEVRWHLDCPASVARQSDSATLRYRFVSHLRDMPPVRGLWVLRGPDNAMWFEAECVANMDGVNRLQIPLDRLRPGERVDISFRLLPDADGTIRYVTFYPDRELELLVPVGGFVGNVVRALLLLFCQVALLAALGVTMGSIFTFPVAVFVAAAVVVATLSVQFFAFSTAPGHASAHHHHDGNEAPSWVDRIGVHMSEGLCVVVSPALHYRLRGRLAEGLEVPWREVWDASGVLIFGYGGVLCLLGCLILRRREMALPI